MVPLAAIADIDVQGIPHVSLPSLAGSRLIPPAAVFVFAQEEEPPAPEGTRAVSYYKEIRPIFQAHCQGCHQPAKANGEYVMTDFAKLVVGGETGEAAIVPGKPDESYLVDLITPVDGAAEMPKGEARPFANRH